jgi:spermidine synthase
VTETESRSRVLYTATLGNEPRATNVGISGRLILFTAFLLTGGTSLVFEVAWTRLLLLSLGATAVAVGAVLGAFMGGMAVGSVLAGKRFAARIDPVLAYALLEGWAGLYGLATPGLLRMAESPSPVAQFCAAIALLMPATVGMGASLPILTRALGRNSSWTAVAVGRLYAANTAGAVLGPLVAVFWLFPALGLLRTLHVASAVDILVCLGVIALRQRVFPAWEPPPQEEVVAGKPSAGDGLLLLSLSVSGAAAMVFEVAWSRTLSLVFTSSVFGVTLMLSTYLAGLASGSALASFFLRRHGRPASHQAVAWLLTGAAAGSYLSLPVADRLPSWFVFLYRSVPSHDAGLFLIQILAAAMLMLPAAMCLGALLPAAASVAAPIRSEVGRKVARLYTANLTGSAAGAVLASAVLLGNCGVSLSVRIASAGALAAAFVVTVKASGVPLVRSFVLATGVILVLAIPPSGAAVAKGMGFYAGLPAYEKYDFAGIRQHIDSHRLLFYRDGPTATVAVHEIGEYRLLKINGKTDASNGPGDMQTQLLLAHLPLLARDARRVAVVGWGSGVTAGAVLSYPVERVDAFEIEPAVVEGSALFNHVNGRPLEDSRLRLILGDARARLRRMQEKYDVIISEPSNPWITGVANLFTQEYFRLTASRLSRDGIICQWFHLYGMSEDATRSLVATFGGVYPERLLFKLTGGRDVLLLGSRRPIRFSLSKMRRIFKEDARGGSLASVNIRYPFDLLIYLALDTRGCAAFSRGAPLNTDDNMSLELSAPRTLYTNKIGEISLALSRHPPALIDHVTDQASPAEVAFEQAASLFTAGEHEAALAACRRAIAIDTTFAAQTLLGQILEGLGRVDEARQALFVALSLPGGDARQRAFVRAFLRSMESGDRK